MRPILIYFRERHLDENHKFTFDFSDQVFIQEIDFFFNKQILYYQLKL